MGSKMDGVKCQSKLTSISELLGKSGGGILDKNGGQRWSLSAIHGLRDTGASMHNGIELPTRGFSIHYVMPVTLTNQ